MEDLNLQWQKKLKLGKMGLLEVQVYMFCLGSKFHINELIQILQTKIHMLQFHDRYLGGLTLTV